MQRLGLRHRPPTHLSPSNSLEKELQRQLTDPWITRRSNISKGRVINVAAWIIKLRMVEDIKELQAKLQCHRFPNVRIFQQRHIKVIDSRPVDDSLICCT